MCCTHVNWEIKTCPTVVLAQTAVAGRKRPWSGETWAARNHVSVAGVCQGTKPPKLSCTQKNFLAIQRPQRTRGTNWIPQGPSQPPQHWPTARTAAGRGGAGLCREGHPKRSPACNCKLVRTGTSMAGRRGETWRELQVSPSCWAHLCCLLFTCFPASFHFPISRSRGSYFSITVTKPCNYLLALQFGRYYAVHCAKQLKKRKKQLL